VFRITLDKGLGLGYYLNMFNEKNPRGKSPETRAEILRAAIDIFRVRGLEGTTMREIASASGVALGAAYYYFSSKEAIIQAYYDEVQAEHMRRVEAVLAAGKLDLKARLLAAFHTKLDILKGDRKLLGALFRFTAEPEHRLSAFGASTKRVREQSFEILSTAICEERLPQDIRTVLPVALWVLQMGILLYFIYDESEGQRRTRNLVDGAIALFVRVLSLAKLSVLKPVRGSVFALLRDAGLVPEVPSNDSKKNEITSTETLPQEE
jgi:AcrR family transcriptional regulator